MYKISNKILGSIFLSLGLLANEWIFIFCFRVEGGVSLFTERLVLWIISLTCLFLSFLFYNNRKLAVNITLMLFSLILTYTIADYFIGRMNDTQYSGQKTYIEQAGLWGNCYPFIEGSALPINRIDPNTQKQANCVLYNTQKRKAGFYSKRASQAVIVGDSFTFGEGVREEHTLGYLLGEVFPKFNFQNYGQSGSDVVYIYKLVNYIVDRKDNVKDIFYFYNINDVLMDSKIAQEQKFIVDFQNVRWSNVDSAGTVITKVLLKSSIYRLLNHVLVFKKESQLTVKNYLDMYNPELNKTELNKTIALLNEMNKKCEENGIRFTVVMYPLLYKSQWGEYPFKSIHDLLRYVTREYDIAFIDLYPAFHPQKAFKSLIVHPLDYHPNGKANALVSNYLKNLGHTSIERLRN